MTSSIGSAAIRTVVIPFLFWCPSQFPALLNTSPLSICIAFPRVDGMHQILFRYHFHKQPLIPDGHMVSGVRTTRPSLVTMAVVRPIKGTSATSGAVKKDGECGMAQDWAYAPTESPFLGSTITASFLR